MFRQKLTLRLGVLVLALLAFAVILAGPRIAARTADTPPGQGKDDSVQAGIYRGVLPVVKFDVSPPLSSLRGSVVPPGQLREEERENPYKGIYGPQSIDPVVQSRLGPPLIPTPIISFDGNPNLCGGCAPPDPNGDVGPNHFVTMANLHYQVFNKSGTSLLGPLANNTLWAGFGGPCQTQNAGDPVVLYDQLADRWLLSQFTSTGPTWYNCIALSTGPDPTGTFYRWAFSTGGNFPDYPKYGMWPDAYHISTREFAGGATFAGVGAYAGDRTQMLAGNPNPTVISFLVPPGGTPYNIGDGLLPADLDGTRLPPGGSPQFYLGSMDNGGPYGAPADALTLWKFVANFANPPASSFTLANTLPIAAYDTVLDACGGGRACIPQPGTANRIDHLGYRQRPLFRLAYRNMGGYESLVTNQSVEASAISGIRWWELRSPNSSPVVFQDATYAPGVQDGIHRWMGSIAMDFQGNMGLAYSASSATLFPSIRYTGRLVGDPINTMPQGEASIIEGTGSQTGGGSRWGDYTDLVVDPVDDCTFWHTNEYVPTTSAAGWRLRVGAFKFPNCSQGTPTPTVTGTPPTATRTSTATNTPLPPTATATPDPCLTQNYTFTTATATIVTGTTNIGQSCDDCSNTIALPFAVRFYGQNYNNVNVISNGNLQFVSSNTAFTNACLPDATMDQLVAPLWDDLRSDTGAGCSSFPGGCGVFTATTGAVGSRVFIIEWRSVYFAVPATAVNIAVRFYENSPTNRIDFMYGAGVGSSTATIGLQRGTGGTFIQYSCNTPAPATGLLITWQQQPCNTPTPAPPSNTPTPVPPTVTPTSAASATSTPCAIQFTDVDQNNPFYSFIRCLACRLIVSGYSDNTFRWGNNVTRGQLSKIIAGAANLQNVIPSSQQTFEDVPNTNVFWIFIERLAGIQAISGYNCGGPGEPCGPGNRPYFRWGNNATRGQISKITAVTAGWNGPIPTTQQTFEDVPPSNAFWLWIEELASRNIISGYNCGGPGEPCGPGNRPYFRWGNNATRGQMSKIAAESFFSGCVTPARK